MSCACATGRCSTVSDAPAEAIVHQLGALASALRAQGSRVGLGELLAAHEALDAVDSASREDARLALRTVLCSERDDLIKFERAFVIVFGDGRPSGVETPLDELGKIERAAVPHAGFPTAG